MFRSEIGSGFEDSGGELDFDLSSVDLSFLGIGGRTVPKTQSHYNLTALKLKLCRLKLSSWSWDPTICVLWGGALSQLARILNT